MISSKEVAVIASDFSKKIRDVSLLFFALLGFAVQMPVTIASAYIFILVLGLFHNSGCSYQTIGIVSLCSLLLLLSVLSFNHGIAPLFYLFFLPFVFLISKGFSRNKLDYLVSVVSLLYWVSAVLIIFAGIINIDQPEPLGAVFPWSSTNGLPSYLIVIQVLYSLLYYLRYSRLPIFSVVATLCVAFLGLGRGSIMIAVLILLLTLSVEIHRIVRGRTILMLILVAFSFFGLCLAVWFAPVFSLDLQSTLDGTKFAGGILDEHRGRIITDYIGKIDGWGMVFGASYDGTSIVTSYGGNPHNSYIRLHSFYGVLGLVFFVLPFFLMARSRAIFRQKMVAFLLISLVALRAVSEPIFFPTVLDFFYFLCFFVFFRFSRKKDG